MRRSPPPARRTELARGTTLLRRTPLRSLGDTVACRARDTGPTAKTRAVVHARSGDRCEWPACPRLRRDVHHRLNRKVGGRHGEMRQRLNGAEWLVDACRHHHNLATRAVGDDRVLVESMGWVLREGDDAVLVPILTRHSTRPVLLAGDGTYRTT